MPVPSPSPSLPILTARVQLHVLRYHVWRLSELWDVQRPYNFNDFAGVLTLVTNGVTNGALGNVWWWDVQTWAFLSFACSHMMVCNGSWCSFMTVTVCSVCTACTQQMCIEGRNTLFLQLTSTRGSAPNNNDTQHPTAIVREQPRGNRPHGRTQTPTTCH